MLGILSLKNYCTSRLHLINSKYQLNTTQGRIVKLTSISSLLEFYNFTVYGLFSVYFTAQFFPHQEILIAVIASYVIFIIGYIARPIGGIVFSHIGDKFGRKLVLILTTSILGSSSLVIVFLPTYSHIGIFAPIVLLLVRILQGLAIGGELPNMIVYVSETMADKRNYTLGIVLAGTDAGLVLSILVNVIIVSIMPPHALYSYGWRIPFILGGILCYLSYQIRKKLEETAAFKTVKYKPKSPLLHLIKYYPRETLYACGVTAAMATFVMLSLIFMPTYLNDIAKIPFSRYSLDMFIAAFITTVSAYIMGVIAMYFNPQKIMLICNIASIFITAISYILIANKIYLLLALCLLTILQGFFAALSPILISSIFPTEVRLTGIALSYNLAHTIFGGLAPIIITFVIKRTGYAYLTPVLYITVTMLVTFITTILSNRIKLMKH